MTWVRLWRAGHIVVLLSFVCAGVARAQVDSMRTEGSPVWSANPGLTRLPRVSHHEVRQAEDWHAEVNHSEVNQAEGKQAESAEQPLYWLTESQIPEIISPDQESPEAAPPIDGPWWNRQITGPLGSRPTQIAIDLPTLMMLAAQYSARVMAVKQEPWIKHAEVDIARAAFDPVLHSTSRVDSISDPVGNALTTGGPDRLREDLWAFDAGVRGRSVSGTKYSLQQELGHDRSNSIFFIPQNQGNSRLRARLAHPLMRGRAIDAQRSLVLTTKIETNSAWAEFHALLQQRLERVGELYWAIYYERANLVIREKHLFRAERIAGLLEARKTVDSVRSQVIRARSAVANRRAELSQAGARIMNLESQLRAATNAPDLNADPRAEFVTVQLAEPDSVQFDYHGSVAAALGDRPEIRKAASDLEAATVRLKLARNNIQPRMDLIAEGYVAGLQGSSDIAGAWANQFSDGRPSYAAGIDFELPRYNRSAEAEVRKSLREIRQLEFTLTDTQETIRSEVEIAIRNVEAARDAILSRQMSVEAVTSEMEYVEDRWQTLVGDPQLGQIQLDDLLNSQVRMLQEELSLLRALVDYNLALLEVQRAVGGLVRLSQPIQTGQTQ